MTERANNDQLSEMFGSDSDNEDNEDSNRGKDNETTRPAACGIFSFHNGTEEAMFAYVQANATRGNPSSILTAIDRFCYSRHWMMHVGEKKLNQLRQALALHPSAKLCVEIGSYCGYSAVFLASIVQSDAKLYCIENSPLCVRWTRRLIEFAGLQSKVHILQGSITGGGDAEDAINLLRSELSEDSHIDFMFIDHDKSRYLVDLQRIEQSGLLQSGTVVCADNILSHGIPLREYLHHVKDNSSEGLYASSKTYLGEIEYAGASQTNATEGDTTNGLGDEIETYHELTRRLQECPNKTTIDAIEISIYR